VASVVSLVHFNLKEFLRSKSNTNIIGDTFTVTVNVYIYIFVFKVHGKENNIMISMFLPSCFEARKSQMAATRLKVRTGALVA
jgi:hypothetical protein